LGNCSGDCPNGRCLTRYRGTIDPATRPSSPRYERPDYGDREGASYRPSYRSERPTHRDYSDRDYTNREFRDRDSRDRSYRDEPVSRRSWRSESRPMNRDRDVESPFYN
jgi:hypothetical protein